MSEIKNNLEVVATIEAKELIEKLLETKKTSPYESKDLDKLAEALAKAQGSFKAASKEAANPYFKSKYSTLADIVTAARESLSANGLAVIQRSLPYNGSMGLYTRLLHASGQWMESVIPIAPPKADIQAIGSYLTYLRRYMFATVVGVVSDEADDDGESAMQRKPAEEAKLSPAQIEYITNMMNQLQTSEVEQFMKECSIDAVAEIAAKDASAVINTLKRRVMLSKGGAK